MLLLAVKEGGIMDPGAIRTGNTKTPFTTSTRDTFSQDESPEVRAKSIAGSLLAVTVHEPPPKNPLLKPFGGLYQLLTSRTLVHGGPLMAENTRLQQEMILKLLLDGLHARIKKRSMFTQFRNSFDLSDMKPLFREKGYKWEDHLNLLVDTSMKKVLQQGLSKNRRRQIKKSLENGAKVIYHPKPAQIDAFYQILEDLYARKVGKPLPSRNFFHALNPGNSEKARSKNLNSISLLVAFKNRIIGGIACPVMPGRAVYEWYICGLDHEYKNQGIYPSVLATWAAMEYAADQNIPRFDFMGLGNPNVTYGVRAFKERFGGTRVNYGRFQKINRRILYTLAEIGYNVLFFLK